MKMMARCCGALGIVVVPLLISAAVAQTGGGFDLSWSTIDAGGGTFSSGNGFALGGTIGQSDAGTLSGGGFTVNGGFWAGVSSAGAPSCAGDCGGDGTVTVDELIRMVNIALGNAPVSDCTAGDADGSGEITIDELVRAVNNALNGCP